MSKFFLNLQEIDKENVNFQLNSANKNAASKLSFNEKFKIMSKNERVNLQTKTKGFYFSN